MKYSYLAQRIEASTQKRPEDLPLAYIWDRVAAFVADFLIVSLLANVLLAPIKKKIQMAILNQYDGAMNFYIFCIALGVSIIFILYHTLSVFFFKKTLGKKAFQIEVAPLVHGQVLTLTHSLLRAISLYFSILFLFFPLLEVFSNPLRRPFHDRVADSYVRGVKKFGSSPTLKEKMCVRIFYVILLGNLGLILAAQVSYYRQEISSLSEFVTEPEYLCDAVSAAKENWPTSEKATRLDIALTLYGADSASLDCLEKEAQRAMNYGEEIDKAYLAKVFIHEDQADLSDRYLKKVCESNPEGQPCLMSKMISFWADKDWRSVNKILERNDFSNASMKAWMKIWAIKHYEKTQDYEKMLSLMEPLWPNSFLNDFISRNKTLTLWKMNKVSESKELFQTTYAYLPENQQLSFLTEMCNLEVEQSCAMAQSGGCHLLVNKMKDEFNENVAGETLLTYIKTNKCGMTEIDDIVAQTRGIDDPKMQMYIAGVKAQSVGENSVAEQIYQNILKTISISSFLSYEVRSHLVEMGDHDRLLEQIHWWTKSDAVGVYHQQLGVQLLHVLVEKRNWNLAEKISEKLLSNSYKSKQENELLAIVFYHLKKLDVAKKIIKSMETPSVEKSSRFIASENEFSHIKKELEERGNGE